MPKNEFRFAIGTMNGAQANSYKVWSQSDELYMLTRGITSNHQKFSFHSSGNCRWARIDKNISGKGRANFEWERAEVGNAETNHAVLLLTLGFPTNHLSVNESNSKDEKINWIAPASVGHAVMIQLMLSKVCPEKFISGRRQENKEVLYTGKFTGGKYSDIFWYVTKANFDCGVVEISMPDKPQVKGKVFKECVFPNDPNIRQRPVRLSILQDKIMPPYLWELGGFEVASEIKAG